MTGQSNIPIQAVLADVDGTLVTNEKRLTPQAIEAVNRLRARGIRFTITSGRPPRGMRMLVEALHLTDPIAAFNGGVVVQPDLATVLVENLLLPEDVPRILASIETHKLDVWLYTGLDWYVRDPAAPHVNREQKTVQFPPKVVAGYGGLTASVAKIVGVSDDLAAVERCEADIQRDFAGRVSAARSQPYYLDVTHPNANKGNVVTTLGKLLSVPEAAIATLGDMPNDVLMFRRSGLSIAMGNAGEDVRKQAMFVTNSNEDEGFAKAVDTVILPRARESRTQAQQL